MQKRLFFLVAMLLTTTLTALAQVTTSSMAGKVTFEGTGETIIGATVQAVHEPSGTRYTAVSNAIGRFSIQGMRTGGPYTVTVSYIGHQTKMLKGITLQLGETYNLDVWLSENANEIAEVTISGKASKLTIENMGASTNITNQQITNLPTVSRSITDITRLSPYGGSGMSFAGTDGRLGNFTVDGANFNNNFGLSDALPGGGNPISIDAIEELQVVISPYDVRQTDFIGGGVNAITKSGTNTFKGTAYVYHKNENMQGDAIERIQLSGAREKSSNTTYGFTLGGPILKDKLFFFVNGEMSKTPTVVNRWHGSVDGQYDATNYVSRTKLSDLETVSNFVREKYGYDTGSWTKFPADESNYKVLARLDWNISDQHHLALRYNFTKDNGWVATNRTSMVGGSRSSYDRMGQYSMSFANSMYSTKRTVNSFSFDLNSRFSDNVSNQLLATYSKIQDPVRGSNSAEFPFIDILDGDGENYMALGYELFSYNNAVENVVWNIKDDVTYHLDNHKITAGLSFEHQLANNNFMRNGTGYYRYASLDDFLTGTTPEIVNLTYGYGGESKPSARVQYNKIGVYVQDEWNVLQNLKLTGGLRVDGLFFNNSDLMTNKYIYDIDYFGKHVDTGKWPDGSVTVSPRIGFSWDVLGDKSLKVRGGTGLFMGRLPLVFFTNMPTNSGMIQNIVSMNATGASSADRTDMTQFSGYATKDPNFQGSIVTDANGNATIAALRDKLISMGYPVNISPEDGTHQSTICGVDPNFKLPQVWKTSVAVDYQLPVSFPFTATGEFVFSKTVNAVCISDWSTPNVGGFARFNGADNRPIYPSGYRVAQSAFMLENTSKGYGWTANLTLNAQPFEWMSLMAAYTHTVNKEITGMPGSQAESAFTYVPTFEGPNFIRLHNSQFVTPDRLVASATLHDKSGNHYSLIYETWRGGYNYSFMTSNDMNGDGYPYDAIFIPTDQQVADRQFRFVSDDDQARFMEFVHNTPYLKKHQGEYAEGYSVYSPWVHRIDFAYKHDFRLRLGETSHKLQLSFDMKNVLNFFNSAWGVAKYMNPDLNSGRILKYEGVDGDGFATFSTPAVIQGNTPLWTPNHSIGQCWYASVGIKYFFN